MRGYSKGFTVLLVAGLLQACASRPFTKSDYKSKLTDEEKARLENGQVVEKIHASYWPSKQVRWQGPLTVKKDVKRLNFTAHGNWKGYSKSGKLIIESAFSAPNEEYTRRYDENGELDYDRYIDTVLVNGRMLMHFKTIRFSNNNQHDTISLDISGFFPDKKELMYSQTIYFNEHGKRDKVLRIK